MEKILRSLLENFESIVCVIKESKDLLMLSVEEFVEFLELQKQQRRKK